MTARRIRIASFTIALALSASAFALSQSQPSGFVQILPDQIKWTQGPTLPKGGEVAVVYGDTRKAVPYITRVKLPADYRIEPHTHPDERVYTVISGTFYIGFGDQFDPDRLVAFAPGSAFVVPANASHFHWTKSGASVVQISGVGPTRTEYVPYDDPTKE
jgi:quercetin dioxygenase-like cupin family protein